MLKLVYKKFREGNRIRPMKKSELLTVNDVAKKLKVTTQYIRSLIREDNLKATMIGSQWLIDSKDLNQYIKDNNVVIEPDDHKRIAKDIPNIVALSFFSGAMGLDIGMKNAGIKAMLACEFNKACRLTIDTNEPEMALIGDIEKYSAKEILEYAGVPKGRKVDIIFGGPPCQAFSTAGNRLGFDDSRGNVFLKYLDIVGEIKPTYVVIENVRGLLSAEYPYKDIEQPIKGGAMLIILDKLRSFGYSVSFNLYNAANFGAPQIRERVVIIAKLGKNKVPYLKPTNSNEEMYGLAPWKTLSNAINNIPKGTKHHYIEFPEKRLKYYRMLKEGQYWKDLPPEIQVEAMGKKLQLGGGKTGFLRRLSFSKPSPTLVTNPTMPATDLAHPVENRPLSVEEYASIQEFPQDWKICGSILDQYKQIGNAVPIKLGEAIGRAILDDMNGNKYVIFNFPFSRYKLTDEISWEKEIRNRIEKIRNKNNNSIYHIQSAYSQQQLCLQM